MAGRGIEYCPVTAAVEAVGDRWTLLVLRELLLGSCRFNDIHRGLPGVSRTLLSTRLRRMQAHGLVVRETDDGGRPRYRLTPAGAELEPVVWQLGDWARRRLLGDIAQDQLDGCRLLWRLRQFVRRGSLPERRVVVEFVFPGAPGGPNAPSRSSAPSAPGGPGERGWLVLAPEDVSACRRPPGHDSDLWVTADLGALHRVVAGTLTLRAAARDGLVRIDGDPALVAGFPSWFAWRTPR
ncbi:winged helix-turn-helix transcriptional regulator [Streptomyces pactum]|uniref:winged helix-turn-helix transcriptional regulator n=1 Tax=Streptomyces pactum TaxID=68249 RepID=UPI0036FA2B83